MPSKRCQRGRSGRGPARARLVALAALTALCARGASAGELRVALLQIPCPEREAMARQIERDVAPWIERQPDLVLTARTGADGELVLRLVGPGASQSTRIPFTRADCAALPATAVLLVRSWLDRDWGAPVPLPANEPELPSPAPEPSPTAPAAPTVTAQVAGGGFVSLDGPGAAGEIAVGVEKALGDRFGAELFAGFHGPVARASGSGTLTAKLFTVGLAARLRLRDSSRVRVDLLAGPAFTLVAGESAGYWRDVSVRQPDLAARGALRLGVRLVPQLVWTVALELQVRLHAETLRAEGAPQPLRVGRVRQVLQTGFALELF